MNNDDEQDYTDNDREPYGYTYPDDFTVPDEWYESDKPGNFDDLLDSFEPVGIATFDTDDPYRFTSREYQFWSQLM
ncbi:MAG TPA: hypothetical protein VIY48_20410 [Candidatus Paceibacterota bacterium]